MPLAQHIASPVRRLDLVADRVGERNGVSGRRKIVISFALATIACIALCAASASS
jgi:hypothetical protein